MAPVAVSSSIAPVDAIRDMKASLTSATVPETLIDVLSLAVSQYPDHELSFITSSAHDYPIQTKTFNQFNQYVLSPAKAIRTWASPPVWLSLSTSLNTKITRLLFGPAGCVPCLQPA